MDWKRGARIGQGSSAAVYLASTAAGEFFAVKSTDLSSSAVLRREHSLISRLCSPFVVKSLGFDTSFEFNKPVFNLFLEYVAGGTVADQIARHGGGLGEGMIRFYAHQILQGLAYLHQNRLVHCDVKGQNVLVGEDGLKISDFGAAKWMESDSDSDSAALSKHGFAGTPAYMAPEVARGEEQSYPADVWALGCTVIEMATGSNPWPEMKDPASALYRIAYSGDVPVFPDGISDIGKDFLSKCLVRDWQKRWTASELLKHPFFDGLEGESAEFYRKSPTSVMDQSFWDSLEESESSESSSTAEVSFPTGSPADRLRQLIRGNFPSTFNAPGCDDDGEWVMVRGQQIASTSNFFELEFEFDSEFFNLDELSETLIPDEDQSFECCSDDDVISSNPNYSSVGVETSENCERVSLSRVMNLLRNIFQFFLHFNAKPILIVEFF